MASELLRMLCSAPLPAVSQEAQADVEQLFIHFFFFFKFIYFKFFFTIIRGCVSPSRSGMGAG